MDVIQVLPCDEGSECGNSSVRQGFGSGKCGICCLSPTGPASGMRFWKPDTPGKKHPGIVKAKKDAKIARATELRIKKQGVDKAKRTILVKAARAEKTTERNLIHATKNSGRSNKDGDHVAGGEITLDTKLQTTRNNPVVLLHELVKVGQDAQRAGNWMGALVLRNKNNVGVVAMTETDFARLLQRAQGN
jgi:hypothetical protein